MKLNTMRCERCSKEYTTERDFILTNYILYSQKDKVGDLIATFLGAHPKKYDEPPGFVSIGQGADLCQSCWNKFYEVMKEFFTQRLVVQKLDEATK